MELRVFNFRRGRPGLRCITSVYYGIWRQSCSTCDMDSVEIWKSLGIPEHRIYFKNSKSNWWSAGLNSPAGPSTEMFYDLTGALGDVDQVGFEKAEDEQKVVEIWNDVFMAYKQEDGKVAGELPCKKCRYRRRSSSE